MSEGKDRASGMKSAYELALERLEGQGIERPKEEGLSEALRERIADARSRTGAKLAEMEILHRDQLADDTEPAERERLESEYVGERRRLEAKLERDLDKLRSDSQL